MMLYRSLLSVVFVLTALAGSALAQDAGRERTLRVVGEGEASAAPDMAVVSIGVVTEAPTASEALDANTALIADVTELLKERGVEARDLQTRGFSVNPKYTYPRNPREGPGEETVPRIDGYTVSNNLSVRVRDLESLGEVLDRVVSAGSNQINGLNFTIDDREPLFDRARREAVTAARRKAELYAEAAGVTLGPIMSIEDEQIPMRPMPANQMMRMEAAADARAVPVEAGEMTVTARVGITWQLGE